MRLVALSIVILALPVAWMAGERHRENCIRENRTACSVLPWSSGHRVEVRGTGIDWNAARP